MRIAATSALTLLLLVGVGAQAGTISPALQQILADASPDQPVSVIVHLKDQAPITQINDDLKDRQATRQQRHYAVITALQAAASRSQEPLLTELASAATAGSVYGYTPYWIANLVVVQALPAEIERLAARSDVDTIEPNFTVDLIEPTKRGASEDRTVPDSRGIGVTPGLRAVNADRCWYELGLTGEGRLIGSLDTGVDGNHPALASRWRGTAHPAEECWLDVVYGSTSFPFDRNDHGTHTTGTMTGVAPDDTIGVAWGAQWIAANAIDQFANPGFDNDIIQCFEWFADPDGDPFTTDDVPDVVQNSWRVHENFPGYDDCDSRWWAVIDNCEAAGVVTCWSAGNDGPDQGTIGSPADRATTLTKSFCVGATQYFSPYAIAGFSSRGPSTCLDLPPGHELKPEISAPGVNIYSSVPDGEYEDGWDGTSMSGPHVAGTVALIRQANPDLDVDAIKLILMQTATDLGDLGEDNTYGNGFLNCYEACLAAMGDFGTVEGYVTNGSFGDLPIAGARVEFVERDTWVTTEVDGFYRSMAPSGTYTLHVTADGFTPTDVSVDVFDDQTTLQEVELIDIFAPIILSVDQPLTSSDTVGPYTIDAEIVDPSTVIEATLAYRINGGTWIEVDMIEERGSWSGEIPGQSANTQIDYYLTATDGIDQSSSSPEGAPGVFYTLYITALLYAYDVEDPGDPAWQPGVPGDNATGGVWERDDPQGTSYNGEVIQPEDDHTEAPGVDCFITGAAAGGQAGSNDVDEGCTTLLSPVFDLTGADRVFVRYWLWFTQDGLTPWDDEFAVDLSLDGGTTWLELERLADSLGGWTLMDFEFTDPAPTDQVQFRWIACDEGSGNLIEAGVDDFSIESYTAEPTAVDDNPLAPSRTALAQNHPNPFNPSTTISFDLPRRATVELAVYGLDGKKVATLAKGELAPGSHQVIWNGRDSKGRAMPSGAYIVRLETESNVEARKAMLVR